MSTPIRPKIRAILANCLVALAAAFLAGHGPLARAATSGHLRQQIGAGQSRVSALSGALRSASHKVGSLDTSVSGVRGQIATIQSSLDADRRQAHKLKRELRAARTGLSQLEAKESQAVTALAQQLTGTYEADGPDLVSVVLESTGFDNLLERFSFAQRVRNQDTQVVDQVRAARQAVAAQATQLGILSQRQRQLSAQVLVQRDRLDASEAAQVEQQIAATKVRSATAAQLASARGHVSSLRGQLAKLQAVQAKAQTAANAASSGAGSSGGSSRAGGSTHPGGGDASGGGFTFPLPKSDVSPPATWSLDDGVDISAPGGTPEYAVCSGTVVLHGIGGFGSSTPVLHCDSPLDGYDYVYYGHAGPGNWTPIGAHVNAGQVISEIGYGIVGISTGPHVEMGFADSSGSPVGPSSAPRMMSLLQASYAG